MQESLRAHRTSQANFDSKKWSCLQVPTYSQVSQSLMSAGVSYTSFPTGLPPIPRPTLKIWWAERKNMGPTHSRKQLLDYCSTPRNTTATSKAGQAQ